MRWMGTEGRLHLGLRMLGQDRDGEGAGWSVVGGAAQGRELRKALILSARPFPHLGGGGNNRMQTLVLRESSRVPRTAPGHGKPARTFSIVMVTAIAAVVRVTRGRPRERRTLRSLLRCAAPAAGSERSVPAPPFTLAPALWAAGPASSSFYRPGLTGRI